MRILLIALAAAAFLFLSGCAQNSVPDACASIPAGSGKENCIYKEAVLSQEPFRCYNIEGQALRSTCLSDATDEAAKKKVKSTPKPSQPKIVDVTPKQGESVQPENVSQIAQQFAECYRTNIPDVRDACLQGQALDRRQIAICSLISSEEYRSECVINIAQLVRDPSICLAFNTSERAQERDLCNANAKAGEIS